MVSAPVALRISRTLRGAREPPSPLTGRAARGTVARVAPADVIAWAGPAAVAPAVEANLGTFYRALAAGGVGSKIVFAGVGKTAAEMRYGLENGVFLFNVESEGELLALADVAKGMGEGHGDPLVMVDLSGQIECRR